MPDQPQPHIRAEKPMLGLAPDGRILSWNRAAEALYGYSREEAVGQPYSKICAEAETPVYETLFADVTCGTEVEALDCFHRNKFGQHFGVKCSLKPLRDEHRETIGVQVVVEAVTKEAEDQVRLWESAAWARGVIETLVDAIITIDKRGRIEYVNRAAEEMFGYTAEELHGENVSVLMPEPHRSQHDQYIDNYLDSGDAKIIGIGREVHGRRKDGTTFPIYLAVSEVTIGQRHIFTGILRNISALKQREAELRRLNERYDAILGAVPEIIAEVDGQKRYVWLNRQGIEFFGEEALGKEAADFFVGEQDTYSAVEPLYYGADETAYIESWQRRRDGEERLLAWWVRPLKDDGHVRGMLSTARDITDIRASEHEQLRLLEQLQERNKKIACLYAAAELTRTSESEAEMFEGMVGLMRRACHLPDTTGVRINFDEHNFEEIPCDRPAVETVTRGLRAGGRRRGELELIYCKAVEGPDAQMVREEEADMADAVARMISDTVDRRLAESQVIQASKLASIGELAAGVGHEINNPVNGIINCADILLQRLEKDTKEYQFAELARNEADRIAKIVSNLLTFSRQQGEEHSLARLCDIVDTVLSLSGKKIARSHIKLQLDVPEELPRIKCRSEQLQQVVMNLILNAVYALNERYPGPDPSKQLQITGREIELEERPFLRLSVRDNGTGIAKNHADRLFDPFFTTKGRDVGTGLGLSVSDGIVKDHGGRITVDSQPGEYTVFHVDLPLDTSWSLTAPKPAAEEPV